MSEANAQSETVLTEHQWFWRGYVDGAVLKTEPSYHEITHRYPEITVGDAGTYAQGAVDGVAGDSWRLKHVAHTLVGDVGPNREVA